MGNAQFDSILAKKLNSFLSLTPEELTWLARDAVRTAHGEARQAAHP